LEVRILQDLASLRALSTRASLERRWNLTLRALRAGSSKGDETRGGQIGDVMGDGEAEGQENMGKRSMLLTWKYTVF